jgi:hypothetical protein
MAFQNRDAGLDAHVTDIYRGAGYKPPGLIGGAAAKRTAQQGFQP